MKFKKPTQDLHRRNFINDYSFGPPPVIFELDHLISVVAGPPNQPIMVNAKRWQFRPAKELGGPVKQDLIQLLFNP